MTTRDLGAPAYKLFLGEAGQSPSQEFPPDVLADVISVEVHQSMDSADMFVINLSNHSGRYTEDDTFAPGKAIRVEMGYRGDIRALMEGEISSIEPVFPLKGSETILIRGYDRYHRLRFGRKRRAFVNQTYAEVLRKIAGELGLTPKADPPPSLKFDWIFQQNESNIDFIRRLGQRIGYETEVDDREIQWRKPKQGDAPAVTLTWGQNLKSFNARISSRDQVDEVVVRGWDPKERRPIIGRARKGPAPPRKPQPGQQQPPRPTPTPQQQHEIRARIVREEDGRPIGNAEYEVVGPGGQVIERGKTDWQGAVQHRVEPGSHEVRVTKTPPEGGPPTGQSETPPTGKGGTSPTPTPTPSTTGKGTYPTPTPTPSTTGKGTSPTPTPTPSTTGKGTSPTPTPTPTPTRPYTPTPTPTPTYTRPTTKTPTPTPTPTRTPTIPTVTPTPTRTPTIPTVTPTPTITKYD